MKDFQMAHNLKELRDWVSKGYTFLAVVDPNSWLVVKEEELVKEKGEEEPPLYVSKKDREGVKVEVEKPEEENGTITNQTNTE